MNFKKPSGVRRDSPLEERDLGKQHCLLDCGTNFETIKKILASLDIKVNSMSDAGLGLIVPAYRVDVNREVDVIEEILRVYGYNNINFTKKFNATVSYTARNEDYKVQNIIGAQLTSLGFNEIMSNSLTTPDYIKLS